MFSDLSQGVSLDHFILFEPGFLLFSKIISLLTVSPQLYLLVINVFFVLIFISFVKTYSKSVWLSVFLFIGMEFFDQSMNIIRQILALSLILCAYKCLEKKAYFKWAIWILLASTFHFSSLVFFLSALVDKIKINRTSLMLYVVALFICVVFSGHILLFVIGQLGIYGQYMNSDVFGIANQPKLACLLHLLIDIFIFLLWYLWGRTEGIESRLMKNNTLMVKLLMIGSLFWALSVNFAVLSRVALYFDVFALIIIPNILFNLHLRKNKIILIVSILILFSVKYFIISYLRPEWAGIYPYQFYFE